MKNVRFVAGTVLRKGFSFVALGTFALPAFATGSFDTTSVIAVIGEAVAAIGLVAAAVFAGPIIVSKGWKWLRKGA